MFIRIYYREPDGHCLAFLFLTMKIFLFKQMDYVELTCLLGGSVLSWSAVLIVLL
jgi:hypothetical protein